MRKFASILAAGGISVMLAACGGGNQLDGGSTSSTGGSTNTGGGTTTATAVSLTVSASPTSIPADGSSSSTISAVAKDSSGNAVKGVAVTFTASAGTLTTVQGTTDTTGTATATLATGSAAAGSTITVTATAGSLSGKTTVQVGTTQETVTLETTSPQIPSDGTAPATITALVRDVNNNVVPNVQVQFSATSGGITPQAPPGGSGTTTPGETDASGIATASLTTAGDPTNRSITVTATVGTAKSTITVNVVGTTLSLSGPASLVQGNQGTYTVALSDSGKNAIANQQVTIASSAGNTLSAATLTTDSSGTATFQLTATKSGADTVSASALGIQSSETVTVSNQVFTISAPAANAQIPLGQSVPVTVTWTSSGNPVAGQTVTFAATRGTLSAATATTNAQGVATVNISSTSGGPAIITATGTNVTGTQNVSFVATTPSSISVQASPSTISINGQSTITAVVRDANNNLVQGKTVDFQLTDSTGGQLSFASATTDSEGVAQTVYTASNTPSTSNGVSVAGTVEGTSITQTVTLTVGGQAVFISLGTGNTLAENANKTQFQMPWVVQAIDSAGHPVNNLPITLTVHSAKHITSPAPVYAYWKGTYHVCGSSWVQFNDDGGPDPGCGPSPAPNPIVGCLNEDLNQTGVFDPTEDINNNGKLDPGDVAVATPGSVTTATDGSATFNVEYPEDHALWVQVTLTATATVQGTQSSTESTFVLPMLASYLTNTQSTPPGYNSPYGVANSCTSPN